MTTIETLLEEPIFQALGWALVHFIWQGAAVAAIYAATNFILRRRAASLRYAAACVALGVMLILPPVTMFVLSRDSAPATGAAETGAFEALQPSPTTTSVTAAQSRAAAEITLQSNNSVSEPAPASLSISVKRWVEERLPAAFPWLVAFWFAGVLFLSLRFLGGLVVARRLRRSEVTPTLKRLQDKLSELARRLRVSRPVRLCESALVEVPTVIGWMRPVILFPASALTGLSPEQLEALLAHELAHVRRYDYLVNLIQTAVETLLFYHPAVWWVSGKIRQEREHCCDDLAVAACGNVLVYARALAELEQLRLSAPPLAVAANGGSLLHRIQRLVGKSARSSQRFESGLAGAIAIFVVFSMLAGAQTSLISRSTASADAVSSEDDRRSGARWGSTAQSSHQAITDAGNHQHKSEDASQSGQHEKPEDFRPDATVIDQQGEEAQTTEQDRAGEPEDFTGAMQSLGYTKLSVDELIALRHHGVTPDFTRQVNELLNQKLSAEELVAFRVHAVGPQFINDIKSLGYGDVSADHLVAFRVHGVTPQFISEWRNLGYDRLSADELVAFRVHGVSLALVQAMRDAGYDRLSADQLVAIQIHGVSPAFIQAIKQYVRGRISFDELTGMRIHGVTPEFIKQVEVLGYPTLTAEQLVAMRIHGVTPGFIEAVHGLGFKPNIDQLVGMRIHGVTPDFIQAVKERGFSDVTVAQLIELRRMNIIPGARKK